jgi:NADPH-dependent curcumin reductase CurA
MNRQIKFASRPTGMVTESNFQLVETPLPVPAEGQVLLKTLYLSVDPYMRGFMSTRASYAAPMEIGDVMIGGTVSEVIESKNSKFQAGDVVEGRSGWQAYAVDDGKMLRKIDPSIAPISTALGILGMPGLTAYFGLLEIGKPKAGETVVVSGAAGAVGLVVGQIAKIMGCRAVGTAGSDEKVRLLTEVYGFDGAVNYKTAGKLKAALAEHCPKGVDVYFDNVGGDVTDAAFDLLNTGARIPVCGQISSYCADKPDIGPRLLWHLIVKQARAEGFLVYQFAEKYKEAIPRMAAWLHEGKLKYQECITEGLENAPHAFIGLFKGENTGKQLVKVA